MQTIDNENVARSRGSIMGRYDRGWDMGKITPARGRKHIYTSRIQVKLSSRESEKMKRGRGGRLLCFVVQARRKGHKPRIWPWGGDTGESWEHKEQELTITVAPDGGASFITWRQ